MFLCFFFRRQSANQLEKCTGLCSSTQLTTTRKNSGAFEQRNHFSPEKVTYVSLAPSHSIMKENKSK